MMFLIQDHRLTLIFGSRGENVCQTHFQKSQFIVVSLKDGMFENANVLYRTKFVDGVSTVSRIASSNRKRSNQRSKDCLSVSIYLLTVNKGGNQTIQTRKMFLITREKIKHSSILLIQTAPLLFTFQMSQICLTFYVYIILILVILDRNRPIEKRRRR